MRALAKLLGWLLVAGAAFFLAVAVYTGVGHDPERATAVVGLVIFAVLAAVPGAALIVFVHRAENGARMRRELLGFVRSRPAFTVDEAAQEFGLAAGAMERRLVALIADEGLDLVFDPRQRRYAQPGAAQPARCAWCERALRAGEQRCPNCGAIVTA